MLMTFHTTRLVARYLLNRQLSHGNKVPLTPRFSIIDSLPYNSDLQPVSRPIKFALTLCRLAVIVISVYVGATLDGEVKHDTRTFKVHSSTSIAPVVGGKLTNNMGDDMSATAKLSCLRIIHNHSGILYKGYMAGSEILCEDGLETFGKKWLLKADFREGKLSEVAGLSMKGMNILRANTQPGVTVSDTSIMYSPSAEDSDSFAGESCHIVLHKEYEEEEGDRKCVFGVRRTAGSGFQDPIDLNLTTTCAMEVIDFSRMLCTKPTFLPPEVSFLLQVIDSMVVSSKDDYSPERKTQSVMAVMSVGGLATSVSVAAIATALGIALWVALRVGSIKSDFTSVQGVAELWGEEKFGTARFSYDSGFFVALEGEGKTPYLGSMEGASEADRSSADFGIPQDASFAMSGSGGSSGSVMLYSQSRQPPESDEEV